MIHITGKNGMMAFQRKTGSLIQHNFKILLIAI
jgi:hypothetical protein